MGRFFLTLCVTLFLTGVMETPAFTAEENKATPHIDSLDQATMKKFEIQGEASEQNMILSSLVGRWNYDLRLWTEKGASPQLSTGSVLNEMIFDNRFLSSKTDVILNVGGQNIPCTGIGYIGYDAVKKSFISFWLDSVHTGMTSGAGQYDKKKDVLEQRGHFTFPLLDKERTYRSELAFSGSDSYKMTVYLADGSGEEYKAIEIEFQRKK